MAGPTDAGGAPLGSEKGYGPFSDEPLDGKYLIERLLGQGGMGAVYRATHLGTKRTVAVKIIHPQFSNNEEFVERFRREGVRATLARERFRGGPGAP